MGILTKITAAALDGIRWALLAVGAAAVAFAAQARRAAERLRR